MKICRIYRTWLKNTKGNKLAYLIKHKNEKHVGWNKKQYIETGISNHRKFVISY